jgi:cellulose biosynthesis protein BcsQ
MIEFIADHGRTILFIDRPPSHIEIVSEVAAEVDFVLIPTQASRLDLEAMGSALSAAPRAPAWGIVMTRVGGKAEGAINAEATEMLGKVGPLITRVITDNTAHKEALRDGRSAYELRPHLRREIRDVLAEITGAIDRAKQRGMATAFLLTSGTRRLTRMTPSEPSAPDLSY